MIEGMTIGESNVSVLMPCETNSDATIGESGRICFPTVLMRKRQELPYWFDDANHQIEAIKRLPHGWDSHGAQPPNAAVVESGRLLLKQLAMNVPRVRKPSICPTRSGGVQFIWESEGRYFEIEVSDIDKACYFFEDLHASKIQERVVNAGGLLSEMIQILGRVAIPR